MVEEQELGILVNWALGNGSSQNILSVVVSFEFGQDFNYSSGSIWKYKEKSRA